MRSPVLTSALLCLCLALAACEEKRELPLSEPGEKLYDVRGVILSRDTSENTVRLQHEAIRGFMEAMTMDFGVRGMRVDQLPPDGSRITAKLHVTERSYWITDVTRVP
jgi:protein SCO1/2